MENYNFGSAKKGLLEDNFVKALRNPNFVRVVNTLDISDEKKMCYTSHLLDVSKQLDVCAKCHGLFDCPYHLKGFVEFPVVEDDYIRFVYRKCKYKIKDDKDSAYLENVSFYKMPDELMKASFKKIYKDDANRLDCVKVLKTFYDDYLKGKSCKGVYLHGSFGCGKSYLISALFNELARRNVHSIVVYFPELLRSLKASFTNDNEFDERFEEIKMIPLLLIDDIGAEKVSEWSRDEVLGSILQYRMDTNLPTFFTSNLSVSELETHLSLTKNTCDKVKGRRIIERIKYLTNEVKMVSVNRRS